MRLTPETEATQSTMLTRTSPPETPEDRGCDRLDETVPRAGRNSDRASRRSTPAKATANATGESQPIHINSVANNADILHARQYILDNSWPIVSRYMQQMPTIGTAYEPRDCYEQHATEEDRLRMGATTKYTTRVESLTIPSALGQRRGVVKGQRSL